MWWPKRKAKFTLITVGNNYALRGPKGYLDFKSVINGRNFWWSKEDRFFCDCWTDDFNLAQTWFQRLNA